MKNLSLILLSLCALGAPSFAGNGDQSGTPPKITERIHPPVAFSIAVYGEDFSTYLDLVVGKGANWNRVCETYITNPLGGWSRYSTPKNGVSSATNQVYTHDIGLAKFLKSFGKGQFGASLAPPVLMPPSKWGEVWVGEDGMTHAVRVTPGENEDEAKAFEAYLTLLEAMLAKHPRPTPPE